MGADESAGSSARAATSRSTFGRRNSVIKSATTSIYELASKLAQCSQTGSGAKLSPEAVEIALEALRTHAGVLGPPPLIKGKKKRFQIEAMDGAGWPEEVLAVVMDESLAQAAYDEALRLHPGRKIRLRYGARVVLQAPAPSASSTRK